jgi:hypothetical protein
VGQRKPTGVLLRQLLLQSCDLLIGGQNKTQQQMSTSALAATRAVQAHAAGQESNCLTVLLG